MATTVIVAGIDPNLKILGNSQSFLFSQANSGLWLINSLIPTAVTPTLLDVKFINSYQKGYNLNHVTELTNQQGVFCLSSLQYQNNLQNSGFVATNLMTFNELENNKFNFYKPINVLDNISTSSLDITKDSGLSLISNTGEIWSQFVLNQSNNSVNFGNKINFDLNFIVNSVVKMKLTTNGTLDMLTNNITTTGEISVKTGTLVGNTLKAYNQDNINVTSALFVNDNGTYKPYDGIYGYLNSSGQIGITPASQQNPYSINCNNRIKASEFNAVSSKEIKNILTQDIDEEALEIFKKINFSKYQYKDKVKNGFSTIYGLIAEDLFSVVPDWVSNDFDFVPNIMTKALIKKLKNNTYELSGNFNFDFDLEQNSLKIIGNNESYVVSILEKKQDKLIIKNNKNDQDMKLEKEIFVYGTYKKCPSITKNNVFELGLVVLKGLIKRLEKLEKKYV